MEKTVETDRKNDVITETASWRSGESRRKGGMICLPI